MKMSFINLQIYCHSSSTKFTKSQTLISDMVHIVSVSSIDYIPQQGDLPMSQTKMSSVCLLRRFVIRSNLDHNGYHTFAHVKNFCPSHINHVNRYEILCPSHILQSNIPQLLTYNQKIMHLRISYIIT